MKNKTKYFYVVYSNSQVKHAHIIIYHFYCIFFKLRLSFVLVSYVIAIDINLYMYFIYINIIIGLR